VNGHPDNILVLSSPTSHWGWRSKHCFIHHIVNRPRNCCLFSNLIQLTYSETLTFMITNDLLLPITRTSSYQQSLSCWTRIRVLRLFLSSSLSASILIPLIMLITEWGLSLARVLKTSLSSYVVVISNMSFPTSCMKVPTANTDLKHLKLVSRILGTNFTNQFSCLETLSLEHVRLGHNCHAQSFFCPLLNLKVLSLSRCRLPVELPRGSMHLLKSFLLVDCSGVKKIDLWFGR